MKKDKIIFMGTPDFAAESLESLYHNDFDIKLVITQKDRRRGRGKKVQYPAVKQKALDLNLKVYQPENVNDGKAIKIIKDIAPDFIVVVAFGQILKKEILSLPKYKCINVHASLLPKYRGAAPINWAIIDGEEETGISIMEMEEGLDTGDIISQKAIPILEEDDYISLHGKLSRLGASLLVDTIEDIKTGNYKTTVQDDELSSYASMLYKDIGRINWNSKGEDIVNLIRGLVPWPVAHTNYKGENFKVYKAENIEKINDKKAGTIVDVSDKEIFINTMDSTLIVKELQFPNKRRMKTSDYLLGNSIDIGTLLS